MQKLYCITDPVTADGFRLAGIDVVEAEDVEKAHAALLELFDVEDVGIIALDARLSDAVDERINRRFESVYRPLLVYLPLGNDADVKGMARERLQRLIKRAVGFDITLKRK